MQSCYRKLCIVVTEICALLLPKSEHSRLPKSVHFSLPFTAPDEHGLEEFAGGYVAADAECTGGGDQDAGTQAQVNVRDAAATQGSA